MKLLIAVFCTIFITSICQAQDKPLAFDERGKLIYYEIVEATGISKDSLMARARWFLEHFSKESSIKEVKGDSSIEASGKLVISKNALGISRPAGAVSYNFYIEAKDARYRFWLTDFEFVPYTRDRYANFVPSTSIGIPLEREPSKLNSGEWSGYIKATAKEAKAVGDAFKQAMAEARITPKAAKTKNTISTKKW